jgi:TPR repeat protein
VAGLVKAQYAVGYFLETGIGCRKDILEANVWYVRAADAGDERAKQRLAVIQATISGGGGGGPGGDGAAGRGRKSKKGGAGTGGDGPVDNNNKDDKECIVM